MSHALHRDDRPVPETEDAGDDSRDGSVYLGDEVNCCLLSDDGYSSLDFGNHGGCSASSLCGQNKTLVSDDQAECCNGHSDGNSLGQESDGGWSDSGGNSQADY